MSTRKKPVAGKPLNAAVVPRKVKYFWKHIGGVFGAITGSLTLTHGVKDIVDNLKQFDFKFSASVNPKSLALVDIYSAVRIAGVGWQSTFALKDGPLLVNIGVGVYTPVVSAAIGGYLPTPGSVKTALAVTAQKPSRDRKTAGARKSK
jgi:hypothetical protein